MIDVQQLTGRTEPLLSLFSDISTAEARVECFPGSVSPISGNGDQFATVDFHHNELVWKIYYPARCNAHQVYHELLHVRWRHLENAPSLSARAGADAQTISNISELNNDFDHAYVVLREIATYPEASAYWERDFAGRFPAASVGSLQVKLTLLRGWMVLPVALPQSQVTQRYRAVLRTNGWQGRLSTFVLIATEPFERPVAPAGDRK